MFKVLDGKTAYFCIDDTLIMWDVPKDYDGPVVEVRCRGQKETVVPHWVNVAHLIKFAKRGYAIIAWSAGGSDWAEAAIKALKLEKFVVAAMPKPTYYFDDLSCEKFMGTHMDYKFRNLDAELTEYLASNGVKLDK
jgi:hypothetical protein